MILKKKKLMEMDMNQEVSNQKTNFDNFCEIPQNLDQENNNIEQKIIKKTMRGIPVCVQNIEIV